MSNMSSVCAMKCDVFSLSFRRYYELLLNMMKKMLVERISRERCNPVFVCYGCLSKYLSVYIIHVECNVLRILFRSFWGCDDSSVRGRSTSNYHRPFARRRRFLEPARADWWVGLKGLTLLTMNDQNQYEEVIATVPNGGQSNTFLKFE